MNTRKTANAVVRHLVDAPLEGDVRITPGVRDDAGGWSR